MGRFFILAFALLPLVEIAFFIVIGRTIGLWPTLLGVVVTALLGALIVRMQGVSLLSDIRTAMRRGQLPARALADAAMVALAGLLLLLPGYFSDLVGFLLLIPALRTAVYRAVGGRMAAVVSQAGTAPFHRTSEQVTRRGTINLGDDHYRKR